ncbi:cyclic nucleotide-binding domain-containing protein, partial [Ensifer sp. IC4062]
MKTLQLTSSDRAILVRSRFFARLPHSTVDAILEGATLSSHEEHDVLFRQGDSIDDVFFVLSGLVRLYRLGKEGREADVAVFPKGAMFLGHRVTASAEAAEASIILRLDSRKLRQLAAADPEVAQAI